MGIESNVENLELSAVDLLQAAAEKLFEMYGEDVIQLSNIVSTEIANDSDHHRTRIGTMSYSSIAVISIGDRQWVVSVGRKTGQYPGDECLGDIVALEIDTDFCEKIIAKYFSENVGEYFANSLFVAMDSGYLAGNELGFFGLKAVDRLNQSGNDIFTSMAIENTEVRTMSGAKFFSKPAKYNPTAIEAAAESIVYVLSTSVHKIVKLNSLNRHPS